MELLYKGHIGTLEIIIEAVLNSRICSSDVFCIIRF